MNPLEQAQADAVAANARQSDVAKSQAATSLSAWASAQDPKAAPVTGKAKAAPALSAGQVVALRAHAQQALIKANTRPDPKTGVPTLDKAALKADTEATNARIGSIVAGASTVPCAACGGSGEKAEIGPDESKALKGVFNDVLTRAYSDPATGQVNFPALSAEKAAAAANIDHIVAHSTTADGGSDRRASAANAGF